MNWKQLIFSGLVFMIVAFIVHTIGSMLTMDYYTNPAYFCYWSELMMPSNGPPGMEFFVASLIVNFAIGVTYAGGYFMLKKAIPGKEYMKGVNFGLLLFLLIALPYTLTSVLLLSFPLGLLIAWTLENLVIYVLGGAAFAKLIQ
ncbi:hypothetical protein KKG31_04255 [Patescibacteria group bacterium]|nr:hypothetical protein [Candidatus Micrarchaeota archaeon]MBU1758354.1 hypothetical protein [Patescibacteria group bacterium]